MSQITFCSQCGKVFFAKRSTAKYCDGTCRQRANRGEPYKFFADKREDAYAHTLEQIALNQPNLFTHLKMIRDNYGIQALYATILAIETAKLGT